jgi:hypothetical protein
VYGFWAVSGIICLSFRDRFDILLEKRLSSVAGLMYIMLYGKSQIIRDSLRFVRNEFAGFNLWRYENV